MNENNIQYVVTKCSLGTVLIAGTREGVCAVLFADDADTLLPELHNRFPNRELSGVDTAFSDTAARVLAAIEAPMNKVSVTLDLIGSAFRRRVWQALREIPVGATATYSQIAERIGAPKAVRAVASACAANPIGVLVPCHRVIRADGTLGGFRWGLERKKQLLEREKRHVKSLMPTSVV
jgi:AraC family transcriptional regulator, regulatory protein of adaptative response / methylated-DNA-[protein]-cysteine methyltransferase